MAQRDILQIADRWYSQLNANVDNSTTSWVLKSSGATNLPARTIVHCGTEKVLVTAITVDTPSAGLDTITVTRGYAGTTAAAHSADDFVANFYYKEFHNELASRQQQIERFLYDRMGQQDGRIRGGLVVGATTSPSMNLEITAGSAVVNGQIVALVEDTTLTFVAPASNPRIDNIVIDQYGEISAVTGTEASSPSAPAIDADTERIARVTHTTAETSIKDTDDATNGYITIEDNYI